jgi:GR25 family glycosyltransferase involved in LPS biosynthesis
MAAQPGAASSRPGASGRKRSWYADPPAFAKVVRVEPVAAPVRLEVFSIALGRSEARTENARAVQQLFAAHSRWGPLQLGLYLVDAFDGEVLDVGERTQAVTAKSLTENAPGYRLATHWCMGSGKKFAETINHETFLTQSAMRANQNVVQARLELHPFHGRQLTYGEVGCAITHTQVLQVFLQGGAAYALVLEDDVAIDAAAVAKIAALMQRLVADGTVFDGLWLFGFQQGCSGVHIDDAGSRGRTLFTVRGHAIVELPYGTSGTQAIIYSRAGAEKLLRSKIVTELINFDDFVNLAVLKPADVHRPDLVARLWPDGKPEFVALKAEPNIVDEHEGKFPSTVVLGYTS